MELENGYYASPRWTYEILDCAMPMTFDTYSNCAHQCLYCFSFFQRAIGVGADDYLSHKVRSVNVEKTMKMFLEPDKHAGYFANYIKRRMTMQWGGLSDGFDWYERKFRKSLELLRFFKEIDYPVSISTKGVWFLDDPEYVEVLRGAKNVHFKYSIITTNEEHAKKIEPGTPTPLERFDALKKLNDLGIGATTLRFRPFIIGTSDLCIEKMMELGEKAGCYSVTTEFLTWESRASNTSRQRLDALSKILGYDVWEFYTQNSARSSGLLRLNYDLKRPFILQMKESAERHNLKFFVSDAHHKEDSYHAGCCGLPESGPLSNVNHGQYAHAIKLAKENGFVKWSEISEEAKSLLGDIPVVRAEGFPTDTDARVKRRYQTFYDYMHDIWNNPKSWQSPARYFGGALVPSAPDENGDIIYLYNQPFVENGLRVNSVNELAVQLRMAGKPNADRYDEMTKDGGDFGHIAYPVYVFSKGRWATASTPALLEKSRINYTTVVPEDEINLYQDRFPSSDIIAASGAGIVPAREEIYQRSKTMGYPYVWMLDDDVVNVYRYNGGNDRDISTFRALMSGTERLIEDYENVALVGFPQNNEISDGKDFTLNNPILGGVYLVNTQTEVSFAKLGVKILEMVAFGMENMVSEAKRVVMKDFLFSVELGENYGGGCTKSILDGEYKEAVEYLCEKYAEHFVEIEMPEPFGKTLVAIELPNNSIVSKAAKEITHGYSKD